MTHPDVDAWDAWTPAQIARRLRDYDRLWYIAAGWSVDLHCGGQTREHEDLEIGVRAADFDGLPAVFPELEFWVPAGPGRLVPMTPESLAGESHQTWAWDPAARRWRFDVFREPHDGDIWICRRDDEGRIRRPYSEVIRHTADGVPYAAIETTLLFKAKHTRPKDEADFARALPVLTPAEREWLVDALELLHPGHPWTLLLKDAQAPPVS